MRTKVCIGHLNWLTTHKNIICTWEGYLKLGTWVWVCTCIYRLVCAWYKKFFSSQEAYLSSGLTSTDMQKAMSFEDTIALNAEQIEHFFFGPLCLSSHIIGLFKSSSQSKHQLIPLNWTLSFALYFKPVLLLKASQISFVYQDGNERFLFKSHWLNREVRVTWGRILPAWPSCTW